MKKGFYLHKVPSLMWRMNDVVVQDTRPRGVFSSLFIGLVSARFAVDRVWCRVRRVWCRALLLVSLLNVTVREQGGIDTPATNTRLILFKILDIKVVREAQNEHIYWLKSQNISQIFRSKFLTFLRKSQTFRSKYRIYWS